MQPKWLSDPRYSGIPTVNRPTPYALIVVFWAHVYPLTKRITDYPQVVLGFALSAGIPVGCVYQGVSPSQLMVDQPVTAFGLACLHISYFFWTVIHDTVYGFQDIQDDTKAGIGSMSRRHERHITSLLLVIAGAQIMFHVATGMAIEAGVLYYVGTSLGTGVILGCMIMKVDIRDPSHCWWWFKVASSTIGWAIEAGFIAEYGRRLSRPL